METLKEICTRLKSIIPYEFDDFTKVQDCELTINEGVFKLSGCSGLNSGFDVTLTDFVGVQELGYLTVNQLHTLQEGNEIITPYKYVSYPSPIKGRVHSNHNVKIAISEDLAFEAFKSNPSDSIYLVPTVSKSKVDTQNGNIDSDALMIENECKIVIYLTNRNDRGQLENFNRYSKLQKLIIRALSSFKPTTSYSNISFISNRIELVTDNSIFISMGFKYLVQYSPLNLDDYHQLTLKPNEL